MDATGDFSRSMASGAHAKFAVENFLSTGLPYDVPSWYDTQMCILIDTSDKEFVNVSGNHIGMQTIVIRASITVLQEDAEVRVIEVVERSQ